MIVLLDKLVRRCWWCGEWAYGKQPCTACDRRPA